MIVISPTLSMPDDKVTLTFIRSSGPGGQNVNKVATAVQLRFDIKHSGLPTFIQERLIPLAGNKLTSQGDIIIKAARYRTQEQNKQDAIARLVFLIKKASMIAKKRRPTKPTYSSKQTRLNKKKMHSNIKTLRNKKYIPHE